jgi:hypothetical protein
MTRRAQPLTNGKIAPFGKRHVSGLQQARTVIGEQRTDDVELALAPARRRRDRGRASRTRIPPRRQ